MSQYEIPIGISLFILVIYFIIQLRRESSPEYISELALTASKIDEIDNIFEWILILAGLLQSTIFQFYTWIVGSPNGNVYFIMKLLGFTLFPLIIIIVTWMSSHLIDNQSIAIFLRVLSWSMIIPYLYFHILTCYLYTFVEFGKDYPFIDSIITAIMLLVIAAILYIPILRVVNKYNKLTSKINYWNIFGSKFLPIIFGVLLTALIMLLCMY